MSRSLNKAMLIGNVGQDPEVRSTSNGGRVATFSLATSRTWNGPTGDRQEKTEWHRCVVWNAGRGQGGAGMGLADVVEKYVKKGDKLYIEGPIEYRQWQDKDNQTRYTTEIRVRELVMLSSKGGGGDYDGEGPPARASRPAAASRGTSGGGSGSSNEFEDFPAALADEDDDLPF